MPAEEYRTRRSAGEEYPPPAVDYGKNTPEYTAALDQAITGLAQKIWDNSGRSPDAEDQLFHDLRDTFLNVQGLDPGEKPQWVADVEQRVQENLENWNAEYAADATALDMTIDAIQETASELWNQNGQEGGEAGYEATVDRLWDEYEKWGRDGEKSGAMALVEEKLKSRGS